MKEIESIKQRNLRVEADKAWETGKTRKAVIALMTYFVMVLFFLLIYSPYPWLNAFVPAFAFVLSTLTLPVLKKVWLKRIYKR